MTNEHKEQWNAANTSTSLLLRILFSDSQKYGMPYGIAIGDGFGKTFSAGQYIRDNSEEHTWYIAGNEAHSRRSFLQDLLTVMGIEGTEGTINELLARAKDHFKEVEHPLLVIDDAQKLNHRALQLVVLLSNGLKGHGGIILMGNTGLRERITEGVKSKRPDYGDIYKSIGNRFITHSLLGPNDVEAICRANGVTSDIVIDGIRQKCSNSLKDISALIQSYHRHSAELDQNFKE
jgi:hypothetical protein